MWIWTRIAGRVLINLGLVVLALVAVKELVDTAGDVTTALRGGNTPPEPPIDSHPIPPMA